MNDCMVGVPEGGLSTILEVRLSMWPSNSLSSAAFLSGCSIPSAMFFGGMLSGSANFGAVLRAKISPRKATEAVMDGS